MVLASNLHPHRSQHSADHRTEDDTADDRSQHSAEHRLAMMIMMLPRGQRGAASTPVIAMRKKHPSPRNADLRPEHQQPHCDSRAACGQCKTFRDLVCGELAGALAAMDVHAPNQMQAVRTDHSLCSWPRSRQARPCSRVPRSDATCPLRDVAHVLCVAPS